LEAQIGQHAGMLWALLKEKGPQTPAALAKALGLTGAELDRAIGWLAREGKLEGATGTRGEQKVALKAGS